MPAKRSPETTVATPSDREVIITRSFGAPRRLVFEAMTSPEHLPHWLLGPEGWSMPVCEVDLRPGGAWRYAWRHADGREMEMHGVYREVARPERVVSTESWGPKWPESLNTIVLADENSRTSMTLTILYSSKEVRDAALGTGMTRGVAMSYQRLDARLETMLGQEPQL
jgi:uncharacterized protein YndB with AHSA1/START domain